MAGLQRTNMLEGKNKQQYLMITPAMQVRLVFDGDGNDRNAERDRRHGMTRLMDRNSLNQTVAHRRRKSIRNFSV